MSLAVVQNLSSLAVSSLSTVSPELTYQRLSGVTMKVFKAALKQARDLLIDPTTPSTTPTRQLRSGATPIASTSKLKRPSSSPTKASNKKARIEPPVAGSKDSAVDQVASASTSAKGKGKAKAVDTPVRSTCSTPLPIPEAQVTPTKTTTSTKKSAAKGKSPTKPRPAPTPQPSTSQLVDEGEESEEEETDGEWKREEPPKTTYPIKYDYQLAGSVRYKTVERVQQMRDWWDGLMEEVEHLMDAGQA